VDDEDKARLSGCVWLRKLNRGGVGVYPWIRIHSLPRSGRYSMGWNTGGSEGFRVTSSPFIVNLAFDLQRKT
jgi:hypothetical protein